MNRRTIAAVLSGAALALGVTACGVTDRDVVNENLTTEADNFNIVRRIVFFNGITDTYLLEVTGKCSITDANRQLEVICKVTKPDGTEGYIKNFLGLSDNVSYFAEQAQVADVSSNFYKVVFKPSVVIPNIEVR